MEIKKGQLYKVNSDNLPSISGATVKILDNSYTQSALYVKIIKIDESNPRYTSVKKVGDNHYINGSFLKLIKQEPVTLGKLVKAYKVKNGN